MADNKLIEQINDLLLREFGRSFDGRPNYRMIWSTGLTEKRYGEFNEMYGHILVRRYYGVKEVLKYPYDQDRYVIERLEFSDNPELLENSSYEPVHVFKDARGFFLRPTLKAVQFLVNAIKNPPSYWERKAQLEEEERKREEAEINEFLGIIEDEGRSPLFAYEDTVFLDSTKQKGRE